jgi:uncharacterized damage-inducible protein DinB
MIELLLADFAYNRWATRHILELAAGLSDEQLDAPSQHSHGSLRALLFHMYGTEWIWRELSQYGELHSARPKPSHYPTIEALTIAWQEEEKQMKAFLENINQDDLEQHMELRDPRGSTHIFTRWEMLSHLLMHSMGHRSEVAAILTTLGHSPGDMDMIFYLIENSHKTEPETRKASR